jgi:CheY-like chemotaxis protein
LSNNPLQPRGRVLLVEDHSDTRKAMYVLLTRWGYEVIAAASVAEAQARLDGQDIAILDLHLPDGLGSEILERIRTEKRPMRVVITTASEDEPLLQLAEQLGVDLLLRKPFSTRHLLEWLIRAEPAG